MPGRSRHILRLNVEKHAYRWQEGTWIEGTSVFRSQAIKLVASLNPNVGEWDSVSGRVLMFRGPEFRSELLESAIGLPLRAERLDGDGWIVEGIIDTRDLEPDAYWAHFRITDGVVALGCTFSFSVEAG